MPIYYPGGYSRGYLFRGVGKSRFEPKKRGESTGGFLGRPPVGNLFLFGTTGGHFYTGGVDRRHVSPGNMGRALTSKCCSGAQTSRGVLTHAAAASLIQTPGGVHKLLEQAGRV